MKALRTVAKAVQQYAVQPVLRLALGVAESVRGWVHDPYELVKLRGLGFILFTIGIAGFAHSLLVRIPERLQPILHPVMTVAKGTGCNSTFGGRYEFFLEGHTWYCSGADWGCVTEKNVPVVYNRYNPNQCRRADRVGKLSLRDWVAVIVQDSFFTCIGLGCLLVHGYDPLRWRRILVRAAFYCGLVMLVLGELWALFNGGDLLRMGRATGNRYPLLF